MHKWPLINDNVSSKDKHALVKFLQTPGVRLTQGEKVRQFEEEWSRWLGVKHSVFVNSGASANYIMTAIVRDLKGKCEVIVPPIGWVSDIAPVVNLGMKPVFVDVNLENLAMSVDNIEFAITEKTGAIVLIHVLGFNGLNNKIIEIAKKHNLILIEDCCESHGATLDDKKVGTLGDMSNFSFYFGHHMTTIEGGMVCTNNENIYNLAKSYRSHGMIRDSSVSVRERYRTEYPELNPLFTFRVPGFNMRGTELNAVIGLEQLPRLDENIDVRNRNLKLFLSLLNPDLYYVEYNVNGCSNFALPVILKNNNSELFQKICNILELEKIEFRKGTAGGGNQVNQPYLEKYSYRVDNNLKIANHIHNFGLYVGNHNDVSFEDIHYLCDLINDIIILEQSWENE